MDIKLASNVDDSGSLKELSKNSSTSSVVTLEPYSLTNMKDNSKSVLYVKKVPLNWSFDIIYEEFSKYGKIKEIRNRLGENHRFFETFIIYVSPTDALRAFQEFSPEDTSMQCSLVNNYPMNLDVYRHHDQNDKIEDHDNVLRSPDPPRWLIISMHGDRGNLFKLKKYINQKLGQINRPDIKRFGRNSFLLHAKSDGQAVMLLNLKDTRYN